MKNVILLSSLFLCFVLAICCNSNSGGSKKKYSLLDSGHVQYRTLAVYADVEKNMVAYGVLWVLLREISVLVPIDTTHDPKKWEERPAIDTAYFLTKVIKDSATGRDSIHNSPIPYASVSIDRNVDSAFSKVRRFMDANPKVFPPIKDTLKSVQSSLNSKVPK